jgi:hypothetical protein
MQEPAAASPASAAASFAGLLDALTAPAHSPLTKFNEDDFAGDIATLSYEQALRTHARYRSASPSDAPNVAVDDPEPDPAIANQSKPALQQSRKSSSITIRISATESAQLHARAAEAGLTVSAYLRSCTLEVEALRGQVKDALAQLRSAASANPQTITSLAQSSKPARRSWFFPRWFGHHRAGPA